MAKAGKGMRQMIQAIIAFLGATVIVLSVVVVYLSYRCRENAIRAAEALQQAYTAETDRKTMLDGEIEAYNEIQRLQQSNELLKSVNEALLKRGAEYRAEINKLKAMQTQAETRDESLAPSKDYSYDRLPGTPTNFYTCEPYDRFAKNSDQAILQEECFTDAYTGIRYITIDGTPYKCVAMATAYGTEIGNTYEIELECGTVEHIIMADFKHDISKPSAGDFGDPCVNYDGRDCINVIEFVCDMKEVESVVKSMGTMGVLNEYGGIYGTGGNIKRITFTGRKWRR